MRRSSDLVSLARIALRWRLQSSADLESGSEDNRLRSCSVVGAGRSYLELLPCSDTVVAASVVDTAVAGIVDSVTEEDIAVVEVGIVAALASGVGTVAYSAREPNVQPKQPPLQLEWVFLH